MHSGVEEYQFVAIFDEKTSAVCQAHSSKVYKVAHAKPGVNLPPLHPWCRSTTIPAPWAGLATVNRSVQDKDGKYHRIPATWNFSQWQRWWQAAGCPPVDAFRGAKWEQANLAHLVEVRKASLRENPEKGRAAGAVDAKAADEKFTKYLFNPENPGGWPKGLLLSAVWGII